jgi:4-amino-4-deoxy-L-arabinose transferase-like glycosyltransferase
MGRKKIIILLCLCYVFVAFIQLDAPFDLDNRDQAMQGLYVLDVVQKGSFFLPTQCGQPTTKPPLYTWVAAAVSLAFGKVTDFTIKLPAIFSGLGVVLITFLIAEMFFSGEVGLFAGLVLILNVHFAHLIGIARTDMMLCFFISFSLYSFLVAYRQRNEKSIYNLLLFVGMGLGSITKGPVAFLLPLLVILIFLFFMRDLKWLKSMRLGIGATILLLIILGWFIPALVIGGRKFFDMIVLDEMVNYFLGTGWAQTRQIKPYFFIGHFFEKFLPWSLFVPSAIARYWKFKNGTEKYGLLFSIVWFLTIMTFFSISKGRRSDYILPLYPAAALIVGQFWAALANRDKPGGWKAHLRLLSLGYLIVNLCMIASLIALLARQDLMQLIARIAPETSETIELLCRSMDTHTNLFLSAAVPLAVVSIFGAALALRGNLKNLFIVLLVTAGINLFLYFEFLSPEAVRLSGGQKKTFCSRAARQINSVENLQFCNVESSILFYMGKNVRPLSHYEVLEFFHAANNPYLISTESDYVALRERMDFEFVVLEESEYLIREKTKYVLISKRKPMFDLRQ